MRNRPLLVATLAIGLTSQAFAQQQAPGQSLLLLGTVADDTGGGLAIVQRADGGIQFLELGQEVDGYTVTRIAPASAMLESGEDEITLHVPGADPNGAPGTVARIRADFLATLTSVREAGWEARQAGGTIWYVDSAGRRQASVRIPEELRGEEFAPAGELPVIEVAPMPVITTVPAP